MTLRVKDVAGEQMICKCAELREARPPAWRDRDHSYPETQRTAVLPAAAERGTTTAILVLFWFFFV